MIKRNVSEARRRGWLIWLHRIGYVTTALVLMETTFVGVVVGRQWFRDREIRKTLIEQSRTHYTPLSQNHDPYVQGAAFALLSKMTPLAALHGDGLRFIAAPALREIEYGVVLSLPKPDSAQASGIFTTLDERDRRNNVQHRAFTMPAAAFRSLMSDVDRLTDNWQGDAKDLCLDGSPVAFERVRGRKITSGSGNCSLHYKRLKTILFTAVQRFAPSDDLPAGANWYPPTSANMNGHF